MICDTIFEMGIKKYLGKLEDLSGKKIIITGGTSGIGLSIVKQLLSKNATVVVLARNPQKVDDLRKYAEDNFSNPQLEFIKYDQSDDESVRNAAKEVAANHSDFYAFILNAGITQRKKPTKYVDGYPLTIKTNFVGTALLLETLLPLIKGNHRIIFQGSLVASWHMKKIKTLKDTKLSFWQQYIISKAGVEAIYYHCSKSDYPFEFLLVEPGISVTDIIREFPGVIRFLAKLFSKLISHSPEKAALTALLAVQSTTKKDSFIVPRGPFAWRGYPKIKRFPKKREKECLIKMLKEDNK